MLLLSSFPEMEAIIKSIEDLQIKVHEAQRTADEFRNL
jgi:hypothetical protein